MTSTCKLCGRKRLEERFAVRDCRVIRCPSCGFVQVEGGAPTTEIYVESYFGHDKRSGPANQIEQLRRLRWLQRCGLKPGSRMLEAGCATGEFLSVARPFYDVFGIDVSSFAIDQALKNYPGLNGKLWSGPLEMVDLGNDRYDAIVMWDVIEHLPQPRQVVRRLVDRLKAGGFLFVSTPNIGTLTAALMGRRWHFMTPPEHQVFFTVRTLTQLMGECGLERIGFTNRGKWVNLRFMLYKIQRVFPGTTMKGFVRRLLPFIPDKLTLYAPTGDVLYAGFRLSK